MPYVRSRTHSVKRLTVLKGLAQHMLFSSAFAGNESKSYATLSVSHEMASDETNGESAS